MEDSLEKVENFHQVRHLGLGIALGLEEQITSMKNWDERRSLLKKGIEGLSAEQYPEHQKKALTYLSAERQWSVYEDYINNLGRVTGLTQSELELLFRLEQHPELQGYQVDFRSLAANYQTDYEEKSCYGWLISHRPAAHKKYLYFRNCLKNEEIFPREAGDLLRRRLEVILENVGFRKIKSGKVGSWLGPSLTIGKKIPRQLRRSILRDFDNRLG